MLTQTHIQKEFKPAKLFSIDRVFRNETLDATHLAEFHQIEGLVADKNLTLGDLMGMIDAFFKKLGTTLFYFILPLSIITYIPYMVSINNFFYIYIYIYMYINSIIMYLLIIAPIYII